MKIKKVDDKPMVIHTKEKAKIHAHEPKGVRIINFNKLSKDEGDLLEAYFDADRKSVV